MDLWIDLTVEGEMMKTVAAAAGVGIIGLMFAGPLFAQSGAEIVKAKNCLNCHNVEGAKKVGSSFADIAAKYKGVKDAETRLFTVLKEGKGHMKVAATDAEIKAAVQYVLARGK
jgi:cytochrome c